MYITSFLVVIMQCITAQIENYKPCIIMHLYCARNINITPSHNARHKVRNEEKTIKQWSNCDIRKSEKKGTFMLKIWVFEVSICVRFIFWFHEESNERSSCLNKCWMVNQIVIDNHYISTSRRTTLLLQGVPSVYPIWPSISPRYWKTTLLLHKLTAHTWFLHTTVREGSIKPKKISDRTTVVSQYKLH